MKRFLGRVIVASVVVFGMAGCSASKNYSQSSQQVSGQALGPTSSQASTPHPAASQSGVETQVLSKLDRRKVAELSSKEALARAVVEFHDSMATKDAAFAQMNELGECAGYFKASAWAVAGDKKLAPIGKLMMILSDRYAISSAVFASKYTEAAKPTVDKVVADATARNAVLFRRAEASRVEIKEKGEVCQEKAALVGMVSKIIQQTMTK